MISGIAVMSRMSAVMITLIRERRMYNLPARKAFIYCLETYGNVPGDDPLSFVSSGKGC